MILRYNNLSIEEEKKILLELWRDYKSRQSEDEGDAITPETLEALLAESPTISGKANSADLSSVATSGSYDDLLDKPTIPTVPTNVSAFVNDAGYATKISVVNHGTSDKGTENAAYTLTPNTFHIWGKVDALYLSLGAGESGKYTEYMFQFTSGDPETTLVLPSSVQWEDDLTVEANMTYQVSIVNNVGLIVGV